MATDHEPKVTSDPENCNVLSSEGNSLLLETWETGNPVISLRTKIHSGSRRGPR